jgi:hypothetical protein
MNATKTTDDLDAVRVLTEALKDFGPEDQQRIFRWAAERLGLPQPFGQAAPLSNAAAVILPSQGAVHTPTGVSQAAPSQDIKSFVLAKNPRSDIQFAATIAYYFQFEAPQSERKDSITGDDLLDACRKAGRDRLKNPGQTLRNAHQQGLLDKAGDAGHFSVNTVGENLVAMTLPGDMTSAVRPSKKAKKGTAKAAAPKKSAKKASAKRTKKA